VPPAEPMELDDEPIDSESPKTEAPFLKPKLKLGLVEFLNGADVEAMEVDNVTELAGNAASQLALQLDSSSVEIGVEKDPTATGEAEESPTLEPETSLDPASASAPEKETAEDSEDDIAKYVEKENVEKKEDVVPGTPDADDSMLAQPAQSPSILVSQSVTNKSISSKIIEIFEEDVTPEDDAHAELTEEERNEGYIIVLDSLTGNRYTKVIKNLQTYLKEEAKSRGLSVYESRPLKVREAKVQRQPNHCDCGLYLIKYLEQFLLKNDQLLPRFIVRAKARGANPVA